MKIMKIMNFYVTTLFADQSPESSWAEWESFQS